MSQTMVPTAYEFAINQLIELEHSFFRFME